MFSKEDLACVLIVKWSFLFGVRPETVISIANEFRRLLKAGEEATLNLYDPGSGGSPERLGAEWSEPRNETSLEIDRVTTSLRIRIPLSELLNVSEVAMKRILGE